MTGNMIVKRLNKSGNYKSELDYDNGFGLFKMAIQPIENSNNQREIKYMKVDGGYIVSGEAYIICAESEKEIDSKFRSRFSTKWNHLIQTEVNEKDKLW